MNDHSLVAFTAFSLVSIMNERLFTTGRCDPARKMEVYPMLQSIDNMRALAELCRAGEPLPGPLASWLASSLQSFLDQRSPSLNDAFGLRNARGGIPWRVEASIRVRDAALRSLCKAHLGGLTISAQAERIHQLSVRYAA